MSNSLHSDGFRKDVVTRREIHLFYPRRGLMLIVVRNSLDPFLKSPARLDFERSDFGNHFNKCAKIAAIVGINIHPCQLPVYFG